MDFKSYISSKNQTEKELDFIIRELELTVKHKILDLACGIGRHSNELAKLGYDVTGVDINDCYLYEASLEANKNKVIVKYILGDINEYHQISAFDRIILLYAYFDFKVSKKILLNIYSTLKTNGLFCFDIPNKNYFMNRPNGQFEAKQNYYYNKNQKYKYLVQNRINSSSFKNVSIEERDYEIVSNMYSCEEINHIISKIGFKILKIFSIWDKRVLSDEYPKLIIIAKK